MANHPVPSEVWDAFGIKPPASNVSTDPDVLSAFGIQGAADDYSDTAKGFTRAFAQVPELAYGVGALASMTAEKMFGEGGLSTDAKNYFTQKFQQKQAENIQYAPKVEFTGAFESAKEGNYGPLADWLQDSAGYVVGQGLQTIATGGLGAIAGQTFGRAATERLLGGMVAKSAEKMVAKSGGRLTMEEATKAASKRLASAVGAGVALNAHNLGMEAGDIYGGLTQQAEKDGREIDSDDLWRAWGAAGAAAMTETATDLLGLGALTGRIKIGGKSIQSLKGVKGRAARGATAAGVGIPVEGTQEYFQTWLEQFGAGTPTDSPESMEERINAAAVGVVGGTVMGGAIGAAARAREDEAIVDKVTSAPSLDDAIQAASESVEATETVMPEYEGGIPYERTTFPVPGIDIPAQPVQGPMLDPAGPMPGGGFIASQIPGEASIPYEPTSVIPPEITTDLGAAPDAQYEGGIDFKPTQPAPDISGPTIPPAQQMTGIEYEAPKIDLYTKSGVPFKTESGAKAAIKSKKLEGYAPSAVEGGYVLKYTGEKITEPTKRPEAKAEEIKVERIPTPEIAKPYAGPDRRISEQRRQVEREEEDRRRVEEDITADAAATVRSEEIDPAGEIMFELGSLSAQLETFERGEIPDDSDYTTNFEQSTEDQWPDLIESAKEEIRKKISNLEDELNILQKKPTTKEVPTPTKSVEEQVAAEEASNELSALFDSYDDTGEITHIDLVEEVEAYVNDSESSPEMEALSDAIEQYRKEQMEDFELGGRGDMDEAEENFNTVLKSIIDGLKVTEKRETEQEQTDELGFINKDLYNWFTPKEIAKIQMEEAKIEGEAEHLEWLGNKLIEGQKRGWIKGNKDTSAKPAEDTSKDGPSVGQPFLVFRFGTTGTTLAGRNGGNAQTVARHIQRLQDFDSSSTQGPMGTMISVFEVTVSKPFDTLTRVNQGHADEKGRVVVGRSFSEKSGEAGYSFPSDMTGFTESKIVDIPLSAVTEKLKQRGHEDFDEAGANLGAEVIREAFEETQRPAAPKASYEHPKGTVYKGTFQGKEKWFVSEGEKRGGGDTIHATEKDAQTYADFQKKQEEDREKARKADEEKEQQAIAKDKETVESYQGFLGDNKMTAGRKRKTLEKRIRANGVSTTRKGIIEKLVAEGRTIETSKQGNRRLINDDDVFMDESSLTKTGMDYAEHLIGLRGDPKPEPGIPGKVTIDMPIEDESGKKGVVRNVNAKAMMSDINSRIRAYEQLLDCLNA